MTLPTLVLIHGAGDTARVWSRMQEHLRAPSLAIDLLGRATRPYDLAQLRLAEVAARAAASTTWSRAVSSP